MGFITYYFSDELLLVTYESCARECGDSCQGFFRSGALSPPLP